MFYLGLSLVLLVSNPLNKKQQGDLYELAACEFLEQQGLKLLDKQARYKIGELDLVMKDKHCLVFIEVRFRKDISYGGAVMSISATKQRKFRNSAYLWMKKQNLNISHTEFRFDIVTFDGDIKSVNWIQNVNIKG